MINIIQYWTILCFSTVVFCSCYSNNQQESSLIDSGNDPHFKIVAHSDQGFENFNRKTIVFGIDIYAMLKVEDVKLIHAANVLAQYLDNDENGQPDDELLIKTLQKNEAFLVMWKDENDLDIEPPSNRLGQDLGNDETNPDYVYNGMTGPFDATLEEVLHLINGGHSLAYPEVFGQKVGSQLADAMDIARGGQFLEIPDQYPESAWYSYDDETCEYAGCMTIEYLYWSITSILGAQSNRLEEIKKEWKLNTPALVKEKDGAIYAILTNPTYKIPKHLPDGKYRQ